MITLINGQRAGRLWLSLFHYREKNEKIMGKGPVGKFFSEDSLKDIMKNYKAEIGDSVFLACGKEKK